MNLEFVGPVAKEIMALKQAIRNALRWLNENNGPQELRDELQAALLWRSQHSYDTTQKEMHVSTDLGIPGAEIDLTLVPVKHVESPKEACDCPLCTYTPVKTKTKRTGGGGPNAS